MALASPALGMFMCSCVTCQPHRAALSTEENDANEALGQLPPLPTQIRVGPPSHTQQHSLEASSLCLSCKLPKIRHPSGLLTTESPPHSGPDTWPEVSKYLRATSPSYCCFIPLPNPAFHLACCPSLPCCLGPHPSLQVPASPPAPCCSLCTAFPPGVPPRSLQDLL